MKANIIRYQDTKKCGFFRCKYRFKIALETLVKLSRRFFVTVIKEPLFSLPIPCIRVWFCHDQLLFGQEEGRRLRFDDLRQSGKGTSLPIANFFFEHAKRLIH